MTYSNESKQNTIFGRTHKEGTHILVGLTFRRELRHMWILVSCLERVRKVEEGLYLKLTARYFPAIFLLLIYFPFPNPPASEHTPIEYAIVSIVLVGGE